MSNRNFHNLDKLQPFCDHDIPFLPIYDKDISNPLLICFDKALTISKADRKQYIVHFYTEDFIFERFWNSPDKYIPFLKQFKAVVSPDFSFYDDSPYPISLYNKYRSHWLGQYMFSCGISVIPNFRLGLFKHYSFSTLGFPGHSVYFCSDIGTSKNPLYFDQFRMSLDYLGQYDPIKLFICTRSDKEYNLNYPFEIVKLARR